MYSLTFAQVSSIFGQNCQNKTLISKVIIDSRQAVPNCLFFALPGSNVDGHQFVQDILDCRGFAVVKRGYSKSSDRIIQVEDPLKALQKLAEIQLERLKIPVIAITGSNGKTSTKDLTAAVLSEKFSVHKTQGNFNNELGVPLTILGLEQHHQAVVLEMAMRGFGQISELTKIAPPDIGIITNIYPVHLELLGSMENIAQAKIELLYGLKPKGIAVLNGDDLLLRRSAAKVSEVKNKVFYGREIDNDLRADNISFDTQGNISYDCIWGSECYNVSLNLPGLHNVYNSLAAVAVGLEFGMSLADCITGLQKAELTRMRLEIEIGAEQVKIINDTYNASPASMHAALDILAAIETNGSRIAVLGDMLELGSISESAHTHVGEHAAQVCDYLICVGNYGAVVRQGAETAGFPQERIRVYQTVEDLLLDIKRLVQKQDLVLVKASRSVALERVVEVLKER